VNSLVEYANYIDTHRVRVIENLDPESIDVYVFLSKRFDICDVSKDLLFQSRFRSFYRLDSAGLTKEWKTEYFNVLQALRGRDSADLRTLAFNFYLIPRIKGDNSLQFSFVTKLAHTLNASSPIYDKEIASAFAFSWPIYGLLDNRMDRLLKFHEWLKSAYSSIIADGLMSNTMHAFHAKFPDKVSSLADVKILDFIFWSAGKLIRTGQLPDPPNHVFEPARRRRRGSNNQSEPPPSQ